MRIESFPNNTSVRQKSPSIALLKVNIYGEFVKRAIDIVITLLCLPLWLSALLFLLPIAWIATGGSPLYGHTRIGRNGRAFRCWKLRTMVPNGDQILKDHLRRSPRAAQEWEQTRKLSHDPRITPLGRILRVASLDEVPQLWNVLRGEMTLVGPRPITNEEVARYGPAAAAYLSLTPGITGLWQVHGRNALSFEERSAMDVAYAEQISLPMDLEILFRTVGVVLSGSGS